MTAHNFTQAAQEAPRREKAPAPPPAETLDSFDKAC